MLHLVLAKGKYCDKYRIIKTGNYEQLSSYTVKFNDSTEIKNNNKKIVNSFIKDNNTNGDIVIMDDEHKNQRLKVLYKKHIIVVKEIIKNQRFMQYLINSNKLVVSEWDHKAINYYKYHNYLSHMNTFLSRRNNYYSSILVIIKNYDIYRKKYNLSSIDAIYRQVKSKKLNDKNNKKEIINPFNEMDTSIKNECFYERVNDSLNNGGYDEIFNTYSLDELDNNLNECDFKVLVKSGYRR